MFNDWQISHFHLGGIIEPRNKVKRTGQLLFAHIKADRAIFLDVRPHRSWTMQRILKILHDVSPSDLPELKGTLPSPRLTDQQLYNLRQNGYTQPIQIDGRVFVAPGLGQTSSQHAMRLSRHADHLTIMLANLRKALTRNCLPWQLQMQLAGNIGLPIRLGIKLDAECLVLYEKMRGIKFATLRTLE
ncbi:hypothetical protein I6F35_37940 [Bradyrhizobium sp. BRP22]|uniref:hypothetical protein n=1 Tax=Bradyrhizobium sp. BRP22 TaxID=2793821 RepID=UPI001CD6E653|nr:hypothetical protein [Bradyrhizobium sp. BRP22]MCA1458851.1 hypothetical protein [Bradyrhizobium sp. BRP22]